MPGYSSARSAAGTDWLTDEDQDTTAGWVAGLAADAGGLLSSGISGRQAVDMARSHATGAAQTAVQDWLSQWGTARVTLGSGEHFSMKDVGLDLLLPWYDTPDNLFFTQHSLHRTDDRTQLNTGAGWRHFAGDQMVGVNLFYDHDLTRYHSRLGLGGEYWRDYLKLSGNGYLRLSSWRSAPELDHDYEARPANGWDLRAEGYLPAWPQLGGKVMVEKYYGDEVALFGKDNRQKDPYAVTAGLSWTPVPLVSFSAEQKQGGSGKHDTRFGMALTYTPGVSLSVQLDPNAVAVRRSLAGSRQDLVDRNNNIVLEYRRKILVKLGLLDPVTGEGGEAKPLVASLQTKYALKTLYAEAAGLTAAGGGLRTEGAQVTVTLPVYRQTATPEIDNSYRVAVVAEDVKGNRSGTEETTVVVRAPQVSSEQSSVTTDLSQVKPDGAEKATLTYVARDDRGMVVSGLSVTARVTTVPADGMQVTLGTFTETKTPGTYTAELTAKTAGAVTVMPQVNNRDAAKAAVTVTVTEKMPVAEHSRITLSGTVGHERSGEMNFRAGDRVTVTVTLQDGNQNAVTGQTALLTAEAVNVPGMVLTDGSAWTEADVGVYTTVWQAQKVGIGHVAGLQVSGWGEAKKSESYNIEAGDVDPLKSEVSVSPSVIVADGSAQATVTYVAVDTHGNAVSGLTAPGLSISGVPDTTFSGFMESGTKGTYTGVLTSGTTAGEATLMPQAGGQDMAKAAATLTLVAGEPVAGNSEISLSAEDGSEQAGEVIFRGGDRVTVTVTLKDKTQNTVTGRAALLYHSVDLPAVRILDGNQWEENLPGIYTIVGQALHTGDGYVASLQLSDWDVAKKSEAYTIVAGTPDAVKSSIHVNTELYYTGDVMELTVILQDKVNNTVSGMADKLFDVVRVDGAGDYVPEGDFAWKESEVQPGLYHANYVALVAPREFTRSQLCWNGWDDCAISNGYSTEESKITKLVIGPDPENGFSPDQGFPKTGFSGASFKVQINGGTPSGWVFKTDSGWASVDNDGVVTFKANGEAGTQVTVTASRGPVELSYKFTLNAWLYMASESKVSWHGAIEICEGRGDEIASLETLSTVSTIFERQKFDVRSVGNLFGEWAFPGYYGTDYGLTKLGDMLYAGAKVWPGFPTWMAPTLELMASREELEANFKEASISTAFPICMRRASNGR
ncbi:inverse autotransporter beta domain-containing protein [Escherichia fergusonii]